MLGCLMLLLTLVMSMAGEIRMNGSTTTFLTVVQKNKDDVAKETKTTITTIASTTGKGFAALAAGQVEVTMSADTLENTVNAANKMGIAAKVEDYEEVYLKDSAIVFIANKSNPVHDLTEAQLRGMLSGEITKWADVGGPALPIVVYFEKEQSANASMIKGRLLKDTPLSKKITFVDNVRHIASNVGELESGFGPTPVMYLNDSVKVISDYKFTQHLGFIIRKDASREVRNVVAAFKAKL
jgi:ABC-type phosphate transport system substrate-binding protein